MQEWARFANLTFDFVRGVQGCMALENSRLPPPFEELMHRHEREIMRYLLRVTGHREDAADLFQETFIRAYRAYPRLNSNGDVRPWLYTIATNLCRNRARDTARSSRRMKTKATQPSACANWCPAFRPSSASHFICATSPVSSTRK